MVPKLIFQGAIGAVACAAALSAAMLPLRPEAGATRPVVVELFTSQGCSTCPPADALLTELADQPGVLALTFHVAYWDYIGWEDPFATAESTDRQRDSVAKLGPGSDTTPQTAHYAPRTAARPNRPHLHHP